MFTERRIKLHVSKEQVSKSLWTYFKSITAATCALNSNYNLSNYGNWKDKINLVSTVDMNTILLN